MEMRGGGQRTSLIVQRRITRTRWLEWLGFCVWGCPSRKIASNLWSRIRVPINFKNILKLS